jgi:tellurite resistance protein
MKTLSKWVQEAFTKFIDPEREDRVRHLALAIKRGLQAKRERFKLSIAIAGLEQTDKDVELATARVYRDVLKKLWDDNQLTARERNMTEWVADRLELPAGTADRMNMDFARQHFASALARSMRDGVLDSAEEDQLEKIARSVGLSTADFVREFFEAEGESFLRAIFLSVVEDGELTAAEWEGLLSTSRKFGISKDVLLKTIEPQAQQFVEHVLADAKSDGRLSKSEAATLQWLLDNLGLSDEFRHYVLSELADLKLMTDIADGRLPAVQTPNWMETQAGEIVHFVSAAEWRELKMLRSGPHVEEHPGTLAITDCRILFSSYTNR